MYFSQIFSIKEGSILDLYKKLILKSFSPGILPNAPSKIVSTFWSTLWHQFRFKSNVFNLFNPPKVSARDFTD